MARISASASKNMKGLLWAIGLGVAGLVFTIFLISWITVRAEFEALEKKFMERNILRSQEVLSDSARSLVAKLSDWAMWDDTYEFMENRNEAYIKSNLVDNALETLKIDVMILLDLRGEPVFIMRRGPQGQIERRFPPGLKAQLAPGSVLTTHKDEESSLEGIFETPEGPLVVASKPVIRSEGTGPIRGTLIFATYLNQAELERLSRIIRVDMEVRKTDAATLPADFSAAREAFLKGEKTFTRVLDAKRIAGFSPLKDVSGKQSLILKVTAPREIAQFGRKARRHLFLALILACLIFGAVLSVPLLLLKKKSGALNAQRKLLSEMAEHIPGVVYQFFARADGTTGFYYISERAEEIFGLKPDLDKAMERITAAVLPEYREGFLSSMETAIRESKDWKFEGIMQKPSGEQLWFSGRSSPYRRGGEIVFNGILEDISERKKAESEKHLLRKQIEFILGATKTGLDIIDSDFNMVYIDAAWAKIYGDFRNKKCYQYFMGKDEVCPGCGVVEALETKKVVFREDVLPREGNRVVHVTTLPYQDEKGAWLVAEVNVDVTLRKQSEELLQRNSEMVELLLNSTAEAIYGLDLNGLCTFINAAGLKLLGYAKGKELLGKNMHEKIHSKHADGSPYDVNLCPIFKAFKTEQEVHVDSEVFWRKDGTSFFAEYWSFPIWHDDKIIGAVVTFLDVSERKRAQQLAREKQKQYQGLIEATVDIVWEVDPAGHYTYLSPQVKKILGYAPEELLGKTPFDLMPEEEAQRVRGIFGPLMLQQKPLEPLENINLHKDGRRVVLESSGVAFCDHLGNFAGYRGMDRDITRRKVAEEEKDKNLAELVIFQKATMGREARILELMKEVAQLKKELGR